MCNRINSLMKSSWKHKRFHWRQSHETNKEEWVAPVKAEGKYIACVCKPVYKPVMLFPGNILYFAAQFLQNRNPCAMAVKSFEISNTIMFISTL